MFDNSKGVILDTLDTIKRFFLAIDITIQLTYIGYLVFAVATGKGILVANILLLIISLAYLVYFLFTTKEWYTREEKKTRARVKKISKTVKRVINAIVIVFSIIDLCTQPFSGMSLLMTIVMIVGFILSIAMEVLATSYIEHRKKLIFEAIKRDVSVISKPVGFVRGLFKKESEDEKKEKDDLDDELDVIRFVQSEKSKKRKLWKKEKHKKSKAEKKSKKSEEENDDKD